MNQFIQLALSLFFLSGCATAYMRDRECHDRVITGVSQEVDGLSINLQTVFSSSSFSFLFNNSTKKEIAVIWNESFFVDKDGVSHRLFNGKIIDRDKPTPDQLIQANSKIASVVGVADYQYWSYSSWSSKALCGRSISPLGKLDVTECENLKLKITLLIDKKKRIVELPLKLVSTLKKECEGYNLETGEKIK